MLVRKLCVAGRFYPENSKNCNKMIEEIIKKEENNLKKIEFSNIIGGVAPHAGYMYSGYQAIHLFQKIKETNIKYDTVVIVNPNHTGYGDYVSIDGNDVWESIYGDIMIDKEMREEILREYNIPVSIIAQMYEHSAEVMLPLLKYFLNYDFKILPINMLVQNYENAKKIADAIFDIGQKQLKKILFIASSDFSHYIDANIAKEKDFEVINLLLDFKLKEIEKTVLKNDLSICGFGPIIAFGEYVKKLNGKIELLRYGNSGEITSDYQNIVAYAAILGYV